MSLDEIYQMLSYPPQVPKADAQWIIPSSYNQYDARSHDVQRTQGSFGMLVGDIDEGNPDLSEVRASLSRLLGDYWFAVYSTASSTEQNKKWRFLVPLASPITGQQYSAYQAALFDACQAAGLTVDRSLERPAQVMYLPNQGAFYQWSADGHALLDPTTHPIAKRAAQYIRIAGEQAQAATVAANEGGRSYLRAFRAKHSIEEMLSMYGFEQHPYNPDLWRHALHDRAVWGGIRIMRYADSDRWVSLSDSVNATGVGKATTGGRSGDAFDLYVHYQCGGSVENATIYAKQCLADEDKARLGAATPEHGFELWDNFLRAQAEVARERANAVEIEVLDAHEGDNGEWELEWPEGLTGLLAQNIYLASSRPIKQFAIAGALYMMTVGGKKYSVFDKGLNLNIMLVAGTGRGKGVVKDGVDRILSQLTMYAQNPSLHAPFDYEVPISESGMRKALGMQNPLCTYEEELGSTLLPTTKTNPSANDIGVRKILTRLFDSGPNKTLGRKQGSTDDRTRAAVYEPTFTLAGDTQPHVFNALLGSGMEDTGFPSRMIPFFYYGRRDYHNKDSSNHKTVPDALLDRLKAYFEYCLNTDSVNVPVQWTREALERSEQLDMELTDRINNKEPGVELLNRAQIITSRVAGLIAVGINHINPVIDLKTFQYSERLIMQGLNEMQRILASGGGGSGENVRLYRLREACKAFLTLNPDTKIRTYKTPKAVVDNKAIINDRYFLVKLKNSEDFTGNGTRTTEQNIREALAEAVKQDILEEYDGIILDKRTRQKMYILGSGF